MSLAPVKLLAVAEDKVRLNPNMFHGPLIQKLLHIVLLQLQMLEHSGKSPWHPELYFNWKIEYWEILDASWFWCSIKKASLLLSSLSISPANDQTKIWRAECFHKLMISSVNRNTCTRNYVPHTCYQASPVRLMFFQFSFKAANLIDTVPN